MLKQAKAPEAVQRAAQGFECNVCRQRGRTASTVPSAIPAVTSPWEVVNVGTFWRSSPHKKGQNKPVQHCVGVSLLDECTNFHVAYVDRVDSEKTPGASRLRNKTAMWLESQGIHLQPIAGESPWQPGRQSRHLETLKENVNLLAMELAADVDCVELFDLHTSAKNELHICKGYSPNQWAFGQAKDRIESFLPHGDHLAVLSGRGEPTFEETLQRRNEARVVFQTPLNARARKSQTFNTGDLVYFFRRGRGHGNQHESFWYGPARVVCVEKTSTEERNASPGSITWAAHGTTLLRCAPEQLRHATHTLKYVSSLYWDHQTPSETLRKAKNSQRYHNLVPEVENLDDCDALQDEDPDVDTSLLNPRRLHTEPSVPGAPRYWAWGKQAPSSSPGCRRPKLSATRI